MKQQINNVIKILKQQDVDACITGSCLLKYFPGQDVDVFAYNEQSFLSLIYFMKYNPMFLVMDPLEQYKMDEYLKEGKSSLDKIGLITLKFKYNTCIDVNVVFKKYQKNIFEVLSNFDLDIIAIGYDIKTGKTLNLRESSGMSGGWNKWNPSFYSSSQWSCKRLLRQFDRVVKYTERGYDLTSVTNKYISLIENIISKENIYKTERGTKFYEDTQEQFKIVLKILKAYKKEKKISPEGLNLLKTLI